MHLHGGGIVEECPGNLGKILHIRAKYDWLAEDGGLQDIVASHVCEAAADEHDGRDLIELRQFADGVENDHIVARVGIDAQFGSSCHVPPGAPREFLHVVEPLRLSRRNDQQRIGHRGANALKRFEHRLFLAADGTGRDQNGTIRGDAKVAEDPVTAAIDRGRPGNLERVEL